MSSDDESSPVRRGPRYAPQQLQLLSPMSHTDDDNVTIENIPLGLRHLFLSGEVELCRKFVPKPPSARRRCCVVDHPVYVNDSADSMGIFEYEEEGLDDYNIT